MQVKLINLTIGGVKLEGVLIDSGSTCNVIDYQIWNFLKENRVRCESKISDKKLFAYGHLRQRLCVRRMGQDA